MQGPEAEAAGVLRRMTRPAATLLLLLVRLLPLLARTSHAVHARGTRRPP
jgi:hypothetical protein